MIPRFDQQGRFYHCYPVRMVRFQAIEFPVDFVKFDGAMIKKIGSSPRDDALLAGLAKLCGEMKVDTIAEWISSVLHRTDR